MEFYSGKVASFWGLWEAAVKSAKKHLERVVGGTKLSFEELQTLFVQIEAVLNSRPLTPISTDATDLSYLTPGHFPMTAVPSPNLEHLKIGTLSRWQLIQKIQNHFWRRWSREYLTQLQTRTKWKRNNYKMPIQQGDLVLLRDDNIPSTRWITGRVLETFPGIDNEVRAIRVRTASGEVKRATNRVCKFPID